MLKCKITGGVRGCWDRYESLSDLQLRLQQTEEIKEELQDEPEARQQLNQKKPKKTQNKENKSNQRQKQRMKNVPRNQKRNQGNNGGAEKEMMTPRSRKKQRRWKQFLQVWMWLLFQVTWVVWMVHTVSGDHGCALALNQHEKVWGRNKWGRTKRDWRTTQETRRNHSTALTEEPRN